MRTSAHVPEPWARRDLMRVLLLGAAAAGIAGCGTDRAVDAVPDSLDAVAEDFIRSSGDISTLLERLRPELTDFDDVYAADTVVAAVRHYDGYWLRPRVIAPTRLQTTYRLTAVSTEELLAGTGATSTFPRGYRDVAPHLRPGLRLHRITFLEPGASFGIDLDCFVLLDGRWRLFPTPWFVLLVDDPGHDH